MCVCSGNWHYHWQKKWGEGEERVKVHAFSDMVQRSSSLLRREVFCVYIQYQCTSSYTRKGAGSEVGLPSFTDLFFLSMETEIKIIDGHNISQSTYILPPFKKVWTKFFAPRIFLQFLSQKEASVYVMPAILCTVWQYALKYTPKNDCSHLHEEEAMPS